MSSKRSAAAKVTSQDVAAIRNALQRGGAEPGQVDDLVRGVVGNRSRREFVDSLRAWLKARPKASA